MRILHVVYECDPGRHRGGVQKMVYELASAQAGLGHDVVIATLARDGRESKTVCGDLTIRQFPAMRGLRRRYSRRLGSVMQREAVRFDVVHTHNTYSPLNVTALRLARRWSARLFVHSHGALDPVLLRDRSIKNVRKRLYIKFVEKAILRGADVLFALVEQEAEWLERLSPQSRIVVIPNGIEPVGLAPLAAVEAFKVRVHLDGSPVLLYIGRIVPKKNLTLIFEALSRLLHESPKLILLVCGDRHDAPSYAEQLDDLAAALGIEHSIRWTGFLGEIEKRSAYQASDVFLHASISEGMPMAVLEAMAAGLACVVTPGTMMAEAASRGAVLQRSGVEQFTDAIRELLRSSADRHTLGLQAREMAEERYSWSRSAREICREYEGDAPVKS